MLQILLLGARFHGKNHGLPDSSHLITWSCAEPLRVEPIIRRLYTRSKWLPSEHECNTWKGFVGECGRKCTFLVLPTFIFMKSLLFFMYTFRSQTQGWDGLSGRLLRLQEVPKISLAPNKEEGNQIWLWQKKINHQSKQGRWCEISPMSSVIF